MMASESHHGSGHGKAIVVGEHFVLDGVSAVAISLAGLRTTVQWSTTDEHSVALAAQTAADLDQTTRERTQQMLQRAAELVGIRAGAQVHIDSNICIHRGLGSSAALAVAMVEAAWRSADKGPLTDQVWLKLARQVECVVHGRSSGLDPATAMRAGAVLFRDGAVRERFSVASTPRTHKARWLLADVGPAPMTASAIDQANKARQRMGVDELATLCRSADTAALRCKEALVSGDLEILGEAMKTAATCLDALDVVNDHMREVISVAEKHGALAAKQTGAGLGGAMLMLAPNAEIAETISSALHLLTRTTWILEVTR